MHTLCSRPVLCRRRRSARCVYMCCWVRLGERDIERLHGNDRNVCSVSRRQLVRRGRGPTHCVRVLGGLFFCSWCRDCVFRHDNVVRGVPCWRFLRWRFCPASGMHVRSWICLDKCCVERVHNGLGDVRNMSGRPLVRRRTCCSCVVFVCRGLLLGCWCHHCVRGFNCAVHNLYGRQLLPWRLGGSRAVHL